MPAVGKLKEWRNPFVGTGNDAARYAPWFNDVLSNAVEAHPVAKKRECHAWPVLKPGDLLRDFFPALFPQMLFFIICDANCNIVLNQTFPENKNPSL